MQIDVSLVPSEETSVLRDLHRQEMNCQIVLDSWHARGWTDSYLMGRIPAARCNASNAASRATLQKAGLLPCARVLTAVLTS
jgi:hypothetical protein